MEEQISPPRTGTNVAQSFLRSNASHANNDGSEGGGIRRGARDPREFYDEMESGSMGLDERLTDLGIEPENYRKYEASGLP
jgi:hypothetical protein